MVYCGAVRSAILATAWLLVAIVCLSHIIRSLTTGTPYKVHMGRGAYCFHVWIPYG